MHKKPGMDFIVYWEDKFFWAGNSRFFIEGKNLLTLIAHTGPLWAAF
jgi:hypothetical protein